MDLQDGVVKRSHNLEKSDLGSTASFVLCNWIPLAKSSHLPLASISTAACISKHRHLSLDAVNNGK